MSIRKKITPTYDVICNGCGEVYRGNRDFYVEEQAIAAANRAGWDTGRGPRGKEDWCPVCQAKEQLEERHD